MANSIETKNSAAQDGQVQTAMASPSQQGVLCEVCGHINEPNVGICAMCSNYLFSDTKIRVVKVQSTSEKPKKDDALVDPGAEPPRVKVVNIPQQ